MATEIHSHSPESPQPSGTVTFLFTDIEGSTERWERDRNAMAAALRRHDVLMRSTIAARGGYVFKTIGDAFCAAFGTAANAIAAALAAQRALMDEDFSAVDGVFVRMALHTGTADERDSDYFGPAVNRVARLLAVGHGGQILVSGITADLLQGEMPAECSLYDLGSHRLKDLARPEHFYQLIASGLRQNFPALRSLDELPNNLPLQLTSFVGREQDVSAIKQLLLHNRLVTLVGTGGAGKTRCAVQVAAELLDDFSDGVWFVELAPISAGSLVTAEIAQALGVREGLNQPPLNALLNYLKRRRLLLVLDNCEHVIEDARTAAATILRGCPDVRIFATSRASLSIAGEQTFRLPSLAVPPAGDAVTAKTAQQYGAVALFLDRALASDARFALSDENAPFVTRICRRLDGIPLAIELAAARVKVLTPRRLSEILDERFRVLTGGDRTVMPRHQTMRALIDWSYDLLTDQERNVFRKLSIFAGDFTLASATAVCRDDALDELAVLEVLTSLVDKSLVQADTAGEARYSLLESTRQYGHEKLVASGEHHATADAHAAAFLETAEQLDRTYYTTPDREWFAQVEADSENWWAALEWALTADGDVLLGQQLAGTLHRVWGFLWVAQGRRWVRAALERVDATTPQSVVARLELAEAYIDATLEQYKTSYDAAERALALYREIDDPLRIAEALRRAGHALIKLGRLAQGEALLDEALAAARKLRARRLTGALLEHLAVARVAQNDLVGARAHFAEALAIHKAGGAEFSVAQVAAGLAEAEFQAGNAETALTLAHEFLAATRGTASSARMTANALLNVAAYLVALARYDEAQSHTREALTLARGQQLAVAVLWALQHLAAIGALRQCDDPSTALVKRMRSARLLGYVDSRFATLETIREYTEQQEYDKIRAALHESLGLDELISLMNQGGEWNEDEAVAEALLV
ncbi:MAG TPA: adenylate/guanylate cyclase domain-containing protein [Candidatus Cybelea sp.]|jgi:predicted ATPase/class 3 adenylate cyclase|nr:adenylate/guanylate cyclase domain-containing protein [Candidatus Cybelea sp.]